MSDLEQIKPAAPVIRGPWQVGFRRSQCHDTGVALAKRINEESQSQAPYAFAWDYDVAIQKRRSFPRWSSISGSSNWEIIR